MVVTDCADLAGSCVTVADAGGAGVAEIATFTAIAGILYYTISDGSGGGAGTFDLVFAETTGTGCMMVPVELQSFEVE